MRDKSLTFILKFLMVLGIFLHLTYLETEARPPQTDKKINRMLSSYTHQLQKIWKLSSPAHKSSSVEIEYSINYLGTIENAKIVKSSGNPSLDKSALIAISNLRPISNFCGDRMTLYKLRSVFTAHSVTTNLIEIGTSSSWSAPGKID